MINSIQTERLILRQWQKKDQEPFSLLNADPKVREYYPGLLTQQESNLYLKSYSDYIETHGWGLWAVSLRQTGEFIGFIGLQKLSFQAHFTSNVEIGWRLAYPFWGQGYATEGALAALEYGFNTLDLPEIVSLTTTQNLRSRHVMEKIGMHHDDKDDFNHPLLPQNHPLSRHVLYRLLKTEYPLKTN